MMAKLPMAVRNGCARWCAIASRVIAAVIGGYALAALFSVAALALPVSRSEAVLTGMLYSFLVYAAAVIWVFAARTAAHAWAGLLVVAAPLSGICLMVWKHA